MTKTRKLLLPLAMALAVVVAQPATSAFAAPAAAAAAAKGVSGTYTLDPAHTDVLVQWSHFGFSNPSAHFGDVDGTLVYNAQDVSKSSVNVTLPLSGLNSFTAKFDEHLKSADFFDAAKFPTATFKSTKVTSAGGNKLTVAGDLTIKGTTKPVVLAVTLNGAGPHPMKKVPALGFDATTTVKRSDFGLGAYVPNVSDEVKIRITTEALQAAAK
ncbi:MULTISPECIES: YceI family protein [Xanthomonas]|uniref:Polyisoprenoid-binding protein n=2 Tax=Xanthomonas TaxID=338 RepID=A0A6N7QIP6_9XANT|nr:MULTISPECIES: YceI family protein [Xanthomonas]AJC46177.1 polyisoprenoid-binding protein [Xanthomonas sacchari]KAB7762785.1 polyisoprenoid-binding protein [Xanthomonas sp. LMG 12461]KAB7776228.1 polyisoprenoid-binding protein [Xanthomonas sp. LMG 12460]KAB7776717.1 polyisoprenoid-binding protein [Xanthomonas sp. LMG 12459]MCW0367071.1 Protein YceI [Xanthomonas sacchari]